MSWVFKSLQATDDDTIPAESQFNGSSSECVRFTTADPSVKDDFSALGETLSRQFRGFANFLAPQPTTAVVPPDDSSDSSLSSSLPSQTLQGIRNDLAEIGGGLRNSFSMLSVNSNKAVGEISRFASNLLPFPRRSIDNEEDEDEVIDDTPGITHEVLNFVNDISSRPEYWTDFPLALDEIDFEMSDVQRMHISTVEQLVPSISALKIKLQSSMCNEIFWMMYFILLLPRFDQSDFELLATSEIVEARNTLDKLQRKEKPQVNSEDTCDNNLACGTQREGNMQSQEKPNSTQIIEGGEGLKTQDGNGDGDGETNNHWSEKEYSNACTDAKRRFRLEGVSFSDIEDDERSSSIESSGWVQLHENLTWKQDRDSESGGSSDWFDVDEFD
ncbi:uncharacterized protein LOC120072199 [Benincasa hispida]|uniref:uncharacterized protein LOC120072199 n=1 Tax=Benincasa hispida TaxID=102211 RepID=UPI001900B328|nr:uncharacterized protein LOC120072199 [Benincasa hispida]XP_038880538.1 uncharacterized protein LOC120072199 [Benincasa hispida]